MPRNSIARDDHPTQPPILPVLAPSLGSTIVVPAYIYTVSGSADHLHGFRQIWSELDGSRGSGMMKLVITRDFYSVDPYSALSPTSYVVMEKIKRQIAYQCNKERLTETSRCPRRSLFSWEFACVLSLCARRNRFDRMVWRGRRQAGFVPRTRCSAIYMTMQTLPRRRCQPRYQFIARVYHVLGVSLIIPVK